MSTLGPEAIQKKIESSLEEDNIIQSHKSPLQSVYEITDLWFKTARLIRVKTES